MFHFRGYGFSIGEKGGNAGVMELDAFIQGIPLLQEFDGQILGWCWTRACCPEPFLDRQPFG